jgi:predicted anti-sigma-YlaC factor YlaD
MNDDLNTVNCDAWIEAISARADGEDPGIDGRMVDAHLAGCESCRAFAASVDGSRRHLAVRPAPEMPDLSRRVSKLTALADRASRWGVLRAVLLVVAVQVIVLSVPSMLASGSGGAAHDQRHLGAFTIAYGVSLIVVAVRPARARTVLPVALVLALALAITAVVDLSRGAIPLLGEATHLPEVLSVLLVWLLAVPPTRAGWHRRATRRSTDTGTGTGTGPATLRVVGDVDPADRRAG